MSPISPVFPNSSVLLGFVALGATSLCIVSAAFALLHKFRVNFGDNVMTLVRALALAIGWAYVGVLYLPIQAFNYVRPYEVPYLRHLHAKEKNVAGGINLPPYKPRTAFLAANAPDFDGEE